MTRNITDAADAEFPEKFDLSVEIKPSQKSVPAAGEKSDAKSTNAQSK